MLMLNMGGHYKDADPSPHAQACPCTIKACCSSTRQLTLGWPC
jgi:hypothetical protein